MTRGGRAVDPGLLPLLLCLLLVPGCAGSGGDSTGTRTSSPGEFPSQVADAESTFNPSDYGIENWGAETPEGDFKTEPAADSASVSAPDTISGFRVQVTTTEDIDIAGQLRDSLSRALGDEWVYVVYHPPFYKVRVGNFSERFAAAGMLDMLRRRGFPDAWIVPDRVLRDPPPPEEVPLLPDSSLDAEPHR